MRIRAVVALLASLACGAAGCDGSSDAATGPGQPQHFRMVVFADDAASAYTEAVARGARERAVELGVVLDFLDARRRAAGQVQQVRDAAVSGQYIGGLIIPVEADPLCDVATNVAPDHNFMLAVTTTPICGRERGSGEAAWAPGTLTFVSASNDPRAVGATAVQALYDARVGRTPITRFYAPRGS